jgi:hypothetical protein
MNKIFETALNQGLQISTQTTENTKISRMNELKTGKELQKFYEKRNIKDGCEQLVFDLEHLGLNLSEVAKSGSGTQVKASLRKVAQEIIDLINEEIIKNCKNNALTEAPIKRKRLVRIGHEHLQKYNHMQKWSWSDFNWYGPKVDFVNDVFNALIMKGHIFSFTKNDPEKGENVVQA